MVVNSRSSDAHRVVFNYPMKIEETVAGILGRLLRTTAGEDPEDVEEAEDQTRRRGRRTGMLLL